MRVLLINGSPNEKGCTYTALTEVARGLADGGAESVMLQIGRKPVSGCIDCRSCKRNGGGCVLNDGALVNEAARLMRECDGLIAGSPVYYASANGGLVSFMDRLFRSTGGFPYKPASAVASARRAGTTATLEVIEKYFGTSCMPMVSSSYWRMVHGNTPDEVRQDIEGMQTMYTLGRNMAWLISCIKAGECAGLLPPELPDKAHTNFIR